MCAREPESYATVKAPVVVWRRWGRGRIPQALTLARCTMTGHLWLPWHFDWPYDVPEVTLAHRDPHPDEQLLWLRSCYRPCGSIQEAYTSLHLAGTLPGDVLGLYENPLRREFR
jgi:hypothetical protein